MDLKNVLKANKMKKDETKRKKERKRNVSAPQVVISMLKKIFKEIYKNTFKKKSISLNLS